MQFAIVLAAAMGLSGCPLATSSYDDTVEIRLQEICTSSAMLPVTLPDANVGAPYSVPLLVASPQYVRAASVILSSGSLPNGLAIVSADLTHWNLEGTPTLAGQYTVFLASFVSCKADGSFGSSILSSGSDTKQLALRVNGPALAITTTALPAGVQNQAYNTTLQATGGPGPLAWSIVQGTLPNGLSLAANGVISGSASTPGTANFTVQVQNSAAPPLTATKALSITISAAPVPLAITTATLPNAAEDDTYLATVQTTGGTAPLAFSISAGALPANVSLNAATGELGGLHPGGGPHGFTVQVRDSANPQQVATQAFTLLILEVTTSTLPDGAVGQPYSQTFAARGQVSPVTWNPAPGTTLPNGLSLSLAGILSGTPTATGPFPFGPYPFCVEVTDAGIPTRSDRQCYSLRYFNPVPVITTIAPSSAMPGDPAFTLTVNGSGFIPVSEVRWSAAARPTTFVSNTRVTAAIPAADIAAAGSANVTVFNPATGGGLSNAVAFTVALPPAPGSSAGVTDLVSQSSASIAANAGSAITGSGGKLIAISKNGNRVAFASEATNLDGAERGVFVRDVALGATRRVSTTLLGATATAVVGESLSISGDGLIVAFESRASNHVAGDTGQDSDVFVVNTCIEPPGSPPVLCNPPDWVSVMPNGTEPLFGTSGAPSLSSTGRFVAFHSNSPLTGINTGRTQIFVRDRQTNVTTMVSVDAQGNAGVGESLYPSISGTGRYIAFFSAASNLVPNDTNNRYDVFVYDTCFGASGLCTPGPSRVSVNSAGAEALGAGQFDFPTPAISEDGRFVTFPSSATNLVPNDTNGLIDVFLHDRLASPLPTTTRVSLSPAGLPILAGNPTISSDGRYVAFQSDQTYVYDTCFGAAGCTPGSFLVSRVPGGATANGTVGQPAISGDGLQVVFQSTASNLLPGITNNIAHVFRARTR